MPFHLSDPSLPEMAKTDNCLFKLQPSLYQCARPFADAGIGVESILRSLERGNAGTGEIFARMDGRLAIAEIGHGQTI